MKAVSFPYRRIPNAYIHVYDVRSYIYGAILYSTLIPLTVFLAVKKCTFVTMHGESDVTFFSQTGSSSLLKNI